MAFMDFLDDLIDPSIFQDPSAYLGNLGGDVGDFFNWLGGSGGGGGGSQIGNLAQAGFPGAQSMMSSGYGGSYGGGQANWQRLIPLLGMFRDVTGMNPYANYMNDMMRYRLAATKLAGDPKRFSGAVSALEKNLTQDQRQRLLKPTMAQLAMTGNATAPGAVSGAVADALAREQAQLLNQAINMETGALGMPFSGGERGDPYLSYLQELEGGGTY